VACAFGSGLVAGTLACAALLAAFAFLSKVQHPETHKIPPPTGESELVTAHVDGAFVPASARRHSVSPAVRLGQYADALVTETANGSPAKVKVGTREGSLPYLYYESLDDLIADNVCIVDRIRANNGAQNYVVVNLLSEMKRYLRRRKGADIRNTIEEQMLRKDKQQHSFSHYLLRRMRKGKTAQKLSIQPNKARMIQKAQLGPHYDGGPIGQCLRMTMCLNGAGTEFVPGDLVPDALRSQMSVARSLPRGGKVEDAVRGELERAAAAMALGRCSPGQMEAVFFLTRYKCDEYQTSIPDGAANAALAHQTPPGQSYRKVFIVDFVINDS